MVVRWWWDGGATVLPPPPSPLAAGPKQPQCPLSRQSRPTASLLHPPHHALHDVIFAFGGVLAHVKAQDAGGVVLRGVFHLAQAHLLADELLELRWVNLAQALEARNLAALAQLRSCRVTLGLGITVNRLLLVARAKQRRLQDEQVTVVHELVEEAEEIGDEEIADVQAVHIGVRGQNYLVVTQPFEV